MIAGRYTLDTEIGRGGMGVVWRGTDKLLGREVALKRIGWLPGAAAPDVARAGREARLAASLNHAHVVAVFDLVSHQGEQWLVMEHVESRNLAQLVQDRGPLQVHEAAALLGQAADALAAAHRAGIVHRDVKPSNILVTPDGRVKLTDFGIARSAGDATLTQAGMVTGSPAYLAPEVATGSPATPASDVWALGATLFHAIAGHPPYDVRGGFVTALYRIVNEEPPRPRKAGPLLPLLEVTMTREPQDRLPMALVRDRLLEAAAARKERSRLVRAGGLRTAVLPVSGLVGDLGPDSAREAGSRPSSDHPTSLDTAFLHPTAAVPTSVPTSGPAAVPAVPAAAPAGLRPAEPVPASPRGKARRPLRLVATLAATTVVGGSALVLAARGLDDGAGASAGTTTPRASQSAAASADPSSASSPSDADPRGDRSRATVDAAQLTGFVEDYLATVTRAPSSAWQRLTPGFQAASGGYSSYAGFWSGIDSAKVLGASADPEALTVSYTVRYQRTTGAELTDQVTLQLERDGNEFRIAGEA